MNSRHLLGVALAIACAAAGPTSAPVTAPASPPTTGPATPGDAVAAAQAHVDATYLVLVQAQTRLDQAEAAAVVSFDALARGKALAAEVAAKAKAWDAVRGHRGDRPTAAEESAETAWKAAAMAQAEAHTQVVKQDRTAVDAKAAWVEADAAYKTAKAELKRARSAATKHEGQRSGK